MRSVIPRHVRESINYLIYVVADFKGTVYNVCKVARRKSVRSSGHCFCDRASLRRALTLPFFVLQIKGNARVK